MGTKATTQDLQYWEISNRRKSGGKIRDLRIRRNLTGKTSLPRLRCKTNPKQIKAEQEVDFEEEVAKYKRDIAKDIQNLKNQAYKEPQWIKEILSKEQENKGQQQVEQQQSSSASSWEQPISDTQAVEISDYIMTNEEEHAFFLDHEDIANSCQAYDRDTSSQANQQYSQKLCEENADEDDRAMSSHADQHTQQPSEENTWSEEAPPSWEQHWETDTQQPATQVEDSFDWEAWLDEIKELPAQGYKPFDDLLKSTHYM